MKPLLIACDFDGTITQRDTLHVIVEAFGEPGRWTELEPHLRSGAITIEQALQAEFDTVRADPDAVRAVVAERAPVRAGFAQFVRWAQAAGHGVMVCSNGFRSVIVPVLDDLGLAELTLVSNDARFTPSGTEILWDDRGARCQECNRPCKRGPLRDHALGRPIVLIGDGISDRCGSAVADIVFARDGLAQDLAREGRSFIPFDDFDDVRAALARLEVAA